MDFPHPKVRRIGGHDSGDTFLTGEELSLATTGLKNSISLDQFMARTHRLGEIYPLCQLDALVGWRDRYAHASQHAFLLLELASPSHRLTVRLLFSNDYLDSTEIPLTPREKD